MGGFDPLESALPDHIGKYEVVERLAVGGMAEVYLARLGGIHGFEKLVAIKRIRPALIGDRRATNFFLDEARLVATLEHPNIAQVHEMGVVGGSYFFVMEYVRGADLRQLMEAARTHDREISLATALYIVSGVCAALHHAHDKRAADGTPLEIIHRDVSPSNVLLSRDGAVKVCDFGIAKATNRSAETVRGVLKGKFGYMSPEQCRSEPLDRRSDIFSIGILLYELTTTTRLFDASSDFELLRAIAEDPITPPSDRVPGYPALLERVVMRALARAPADRYPTAQAMQLELEDFAREQRLSLSSIHLASLIAALFDRDPSDTERTPRASPSSILAPAAAADATRLAPAVPPPPRRRPHRPAAHAGALGPAALEPDPGAPGETPFEADTLVNAKVMPRRAVRHRHALLLGAVGAVLLAGGVSLAGAISSWAHPPATSIVLEGEASRIEALLESTVRAARLRASGIASTPILRAAVETDVATLRDVLATEQPFQLAALEELELFQIRDGVTSSVVRIPTDRPAGTPMPDGQSRLELRGDKLVVVNGATITNPDQIPSGAVELAVRVDFTVDRWRLAEAAVRASLVGVGGEIALVSSTEDGAAPIRIPIRLSGLLGAEALMLVVTPRATPHLGWVAPVRYVGGTVAGLLLLVYAGYGRRRAAFSRIAGASC